LDEVLDIRDEMETVRLYAKKQRRGLKLQNQAAKIKIQAERKAGQAIIAMKLRGGDRKSKYHRGTLITRLNDFGVSRNESARWQLEARASNLQFETYCNAVEKAEEELSSSGFRRFMRSVNGGQHHSHAHRKRCARDLDANHRCTHRNTSSTFRATFSEIYQRLDLVSKIFATICDRVPNGLETIEEREIPRYLREVTCMVTEVEGEIEALELR
jgi:hypothetical protein